MPVPLPATADWRVNGEGYGTVDGKFLRILVAFSLASDGVQAAGRLLTALSP